MEVLAASGPEGTYLNDQDPVVRLYYRMHEGTYLRFLQSRAIGTALCPVSRFSQFRRFRLSWRFSPEVVISPWPGPFWPLRQFHSGERFLPRRGVLPQSSSFSHLSCPPESSCLSPPRHLSLKPTLLPNNLCFSPEWYLHTSPEKQLN